MKPINNYITYQENSLNSRQLYAGHNLLFELKFLRCSSKNSLYSTSKGFF